MRKLFEEFKAFAVKGNVVEIAIGLVLALVFQAVVKSLVDDVIMQIVAAIFGQPDFSGLVIDVGDAEIRYGAFLNAIVNFLLVAFALFLFVVKPYNALRARQEAAEQEAAEEAPPAAPPEDVVLLREIRDALQRS
jgi:large conductance mechanosensitive channel